MAYGTFPDEYSAWVIYGFDSIGADDPRYAYFQIPPTGFCLGHFRWRPKTGLPAPL